MAEPKIESITSQTATHSKEEILQRCKTLLANLNQRGWDSEDEYQKWSSQIIPWREELVALGKILEQ